MAEEVHKPSKSLHRTAPENICSDGEVHIFFSGTGIDKKDCWYFLHLDEEPICGVFGVCGSAIRFFWASSYVNIHENVCADETSDSKVNDQIYQHACKLDKAKYTYDEYISLFQHNTTLWKVKASTSNVCVGTPKHKLDIEELPLPQNLYYLSSITAFC